MNPNNEPHAWNQVEINGKWYNCDLTWDSSQFGGTQYDYCLKGSDNGEFMSRKIEDEEQGHDVESKQYDINELENAKRKVLARLSTRDYKLKFPRIVELSSTIRLLKSGLDNQEYKNYIIAKNYAKTPEEKKEVTDKYYALSLKHKEENKLKATSISRQGFSLQSALEYLEHCRDIGKNVYIEFQNYRLYSCDLNINREYIRIYGLTPREYQERKKEYEQASLEDIENIAERYEIIKGKNQQTLRKSEEEKWELLKKYHPDFARQIKEREEESKRKYEKQNEIVEEYFRRLHPEYDSLSTEEKRKLDLDRKLLASNTNKLEGFLSKYRKNEYDEKDENIMIEIFLKHQKADYYFHLVHPYLTDLPAKLQFKLMEDSDFIEQHIDEIDSAYKRAIAIEEEGINERAILKDIVNNLKRNINPEKEEVTISRDEER